VPGTNATGVADLAAQIAAALAAQIAAALAGIGNVGLRNV